MNAKRTVLVVEDEKNISKFITGMLRANGYTTISSETGAQAKSMISSYMPDVILLDLGLPDADGIGLIREIRTWSNIPIIVVSARDSDKDKVSALDSGADDYVTKPFSTDELLARIRTAVRHKRTSFDDELRRTKKYTCENVEIDFDTRSVSVNGENVHLTNNEFKIVELLSKYSGRVLTYDYIQKEIWGVNAREDNRTLRVNMANLRRKIEQNPADPHILFTEPGVGYRMKEPE